MGGSKLKINQKIYDITPVIQKVLTDKSNTPMKKVNDKDNEILNNIIQSFSFGNYKAIRGESKSGSYKQSKINFKRHNLKGQGVQIIIPSNVIDIYTRLEILLGTKLCGHSNTLTEASNLIDVLYKGGENQNEQQYRNAPNKFQF